MKERSGKFWFLRGLRWIWNLKIFILLLTTIVVAIFRLNFLRSTSLPFNTSLRYI